MQIVNFTHLENTYGSRINFIFDNQFSLHEPLVEIQNKTINVYDEIKQDYNHE